MKPEKVWGVWLFRIAFALGFSFVLVQFKLDFLESALQDLRFRLRPTSTLSEKIEIVLIDQKTVEHFKRIPNYSDHQEVAQKILSASPQALIYVTPLIKMGNSEDDSAKSEASPSGPAEDASALAKTLADSGVVQQITDQLFLKGERETPHLPAPFELIPLLPAPKTADSALFAKDGVTRRVLVDYQGEPLGHLQLASLINPKIKDMNLVRGTFDVYETKQLFVDFQPPGSFHTTKFEDFIRQSVDPERFRGKIILIGDDLGKTLKSYIKTPYSRDPSAMTLVEMHANMIETFIRDSAPRPAVEWMNLFLTSVISIFTVFVVLTQRPLRGMGLLLLATGALLLLGLISFWPFRVLIPMAHPFLAIFLCYYFFIPYRLIIENRRSWEYQQKNKLLSEVEELKTNFISMMSHDLKTPIARIQGMTEVISHDASPLSPAQREALDHIRSSNQDLLGFINTILNYARIESQGVELTRQPKDLNQILEEVIRKHEFLAKVKHIELRPELEPLFPILVDPDLVRQVFSNLIENAIKYSAERSKILITSEEIDGKIRVQIADQGNGIPPEDLPHIFMKFFRSSNAKASPIKGSGLGLYLAQYFVQLHQGTLSAESTLGAGSTFTVEFPVKTT